MLDHEAREARLLVAIAGSAQHMMQGLVLESSAPLYGRAAEMLLIGPLSPPWIGEALGLRRELDVTKAFSAWGGVPWYWDLAEPFSGDLEGALDALVLDPLGPLHQEPERLLGSEIPPAQALRPQLDAVGSGAHRPSEIAGRLGLPITSLSKPLQRLLELGLLRREQPYGESERGGKKTLYKIDDPFLRLWFAVVAPRRSQLSVAERRQRLALWRRLSEALFAATWEDLCRASVPLLNGFAPRLDAVGPFKPAGRFCGGGGPEWEVVALSEDNNALLLGEVKWHEGRPRKDTCIEAVDALRRKGLPAPREKGQDCEGAIRRQYAAGPWILCPLAAGASVPRAIDSTLIRIHEVLQDVASQPPGVAVGSVRRPGPKGRPDFAA